MDQSLSRLSFAETALRGALHRHDLDAKICAHVERALIHVQEAILAIKGNGTVRSVEDLIKDVQAAKQVILKDQRRRLLFSRKPRS